jgi:DNA polymerase III epsilon subunit-like protein
MPEHKFPNGLLGSCEICGVKRMKRRGDIFYAPSVDGPWENVTPSCVEPAPFRPWRNKTIVMFDVETTGLDWTHDSVTEVGIVVGTLVTDAGEIKILDRYQSLVRPWVIPKRDDYAAVEAITHISFDELERAPSPTFVANEVLSFLASIEGEESDALAAAYNFDFDHPFLAGSLFARSGVEVPAILRAAAPRLDPYRWVQKIDRFVTGRINNKREKIGRHKLTETALRYGLLRLGADGEIESSRAHRADYDAELALDILGHLANQVPSDLDDLMDYQLASEKEWANNFFGVYLPNKRRQERARMRAEAEASVANEDADHD